MSTQTKRLLLSLVFAVTGFGMGWWGLVGGGGLVSLLIFFYGAPFFLWMVSRSTLDIVVWSHALCISGIAGEFVASSLWRLEHGSPIGMRSRDWWTLVFVFVMMAIVVNGMILLISLIKRDI